MEEEPPRHDERHTNDEGKEEMKDYGDIKDALLLLSVALTLAVGHETLCGTGHGGVEEAQHSNGTTNDIEDAEVRGTQRTKNKTGRVERDEHRDAHLGVQVACVLYDSISGGQGK